MTLWLILILMTTAVLAAVAWPFAFGRGIARSGSDVAVYNDQLGEIDRDREAGLIGQEDAEGARIEVSRRLLRATEGSDGPEHDPVAGTKIKARRLSGLAAALVLLPMLAGGMYLWLGSPNGDSVEELADQSPSSEDALIGAMVVQVERRLKTEPKDGRGWEALAPAYMRLGRFAESAWAWQNVIANLGDSADRQENRGEALVAAANGVVTDEARTAFDRALAIDNKSVMARFYVGLALKQHGRRDEAARIWRELIAAAPANAGWVDSVRNALARLDEPTVATAERATPPDGQQDAMIKSMVGGLSERLKANGGDPDDWLKLVRSYDVLGDRDKAGAAVSDARRAFASDPDKLARLEQGLRNTDRPLAGVSQDSPKGSVPTTTAPPEHDSAAIQAMVDKLAERLANKGGDVDSWLMLVRSYRTLGDHNRVEATVARARLAFASDPEQLSRFDQLLRAIDDTANAMIGDMVERLAERLKQDGRDVDGWIQLMRSYVVLGQRDRASDAGQRARIALGNDAEALVRLNSGAKELGVDLP